MTFQTPTRRFVSIAAVASAALMAGCASINTVSSTVATYGAWPDGVAPGTYAFDRLPSQTADLQRQQMLENAAAQALAGAGFRPATAGAKPSVTIQIGARIERFEQSPWDDPFWFSGRARFGYPGIWRGGFYGPYGYGPFHHGFWGGWPPEPDMYLRETALLIRDGVTGKPLYETRANSDGTSSGGDRLLAAMFDASMKDFPHAVEKPHDITVQLPMVPTVGPPSMAASAPKA
jgi:hypothetical protein